MNVIKKGILNGVVVNSTDFNFLVTDLEIGDLKLAINTTGGLDIGRYRQAFQKISEGHYKRIPFQLKLTTSNVRMGDGKMFISANYVLCQE